MTALMVFETGDEAPKVLRFINVDAAEVARQLLLKQPNILKVFHMGADGIALAYGRAC